MQFLPVYCGNFCWLVGPGMLFICKFNICLLFNRKKNVQFCLVFSIKWMFSHISCIVLPLLFLSIVFYWIPQTPSHKILQESRSYANRVEASSIFSLLLRRSALVVCRDGMVPWPPTCPKSFSFARILMVQFN